MTTPLVQHTVTTTLDLNIVTTIVALNHHPGIKEREEKLTSRTRIRTRNIFNTPQWVLRTQTIKVPSNENRQLSKVLPLKP